MHSAKVAEELECYDEYTKRMKHKLQTLNKTGYVRVDLQWAKAMSLVRFQRYIYTEQTLK